MTLNENLYRHRFNNSPISDFKQFVVVPEIINYSFLPLMMRNFLFSVTFWYSKAYTILKQLDGDNQR